MNRRVCIVSTLILLSSICETANEATAEWLVGNEFDAQMRLQASVYWSEVPVRDAVESLSTVRKVAIWLDRRCDPSRLVTFQANLPSLEECFWKLSNDEADLDAAWINGVVLIGPPGAPNRFATVHTLHQRQLERLRPAERNRWRSKKEMTWPRLTSPQTLLRTLEKEVGRTIQGKDQVVHDLWPANRLPPLPAFSRLGLLISGFDLSFVFNEDGSAKVVELPKTPRYTHTIPRDRLAIVRKTMANHPNAKLDKSSKPMTLSASWKVHQLVGNALKPQSSRQKVGLVRYSVRADNQTVGPLVQGLCKQLDMTVEFAAEAQSHLDSRVSFEVVEVDIPTLFRTILGRARLRYELTERSLRVIGSSNSVIADE